MSGRLRRAGPALLFLSALAGIGASDAWLTLNPARKEGASHLLYLPNGRFLRVAALGYPTFVADLIYLWSIQYYGTYRGEERFEFLDHVYATVLARLDPRYVDPYLIGSLIMVVERRDLEGGLRLLEQGMDANPDAWILPYEAGFYAYDIGGDYERASRYFERALKIPGAPPSTRRLSAEMFNRKGDKATSLRLWREVLAGAGEDQRVAAIAANHVHDLTIEVDLIRLNAALAAFRRRHGRPPPSLASLVREGDLDAVPVDPDGRDYLFDGHSGTVRPAVGFRLRRR